MLCTGAGLTSEPAKEVVIMLRRQARRDVPDPLPKLEAGEAERNENSVIKGTALHLGH